MGAGGIECFVTLTFRGDRRMTLVEPGTPQMVQAQLVREFGEGISMKITPDMRKGR